MSDIIAMIFGLWPYAVFLALGVWHYIRRVRVKRKLEKREQSSRRLQFTFTVGDKMLYQTTVQDSGRRIDVGRPNMVTMAEGEHVPGRN